MTMRSLQEPSMANFEVVVYDHLLSTQQIGAFNAPVGLLPRGIIETHSPWGWKKLPFLGLVF